MRSPTIVVCVASTAARSPGRSVGSMLSSRTGIKRRCGFSRRQSANGMIEPGEGRENSPIGISPSDGTKKGAGRGAVASPVACGRLPTPATDQGRSRRGNFSVRSPAIPQEFYGLFDMAHADRLVAGELPRIGDDFRGRAERAASPIGCLLDQFTAARADDFIGVEKVVEIFVERLRDDQIRLNARKKLRMQVPVFAFADADEHRVAD